MTQTEQGTQVQPRGPINVLAIISFVLGVIGGNILAVAVGHVALSQIARSRKIGTFESGRSLAIVGLVLGYLEFAAILVFGIALIVASAAGHLVVD